MKKVLVLLLLMVSTSVFSEWTAVSVSSDNNRTNYVDVGTIKKKGNKVKMWTMYDYKTVKMIDKNEKQTVRYLSMVNYDEYDCEEETWKMLDLYLYSGNMGDGEVVGSSTNIKDEAKSVIPGSITETLFKIACGKK